MGRRGRPPHPDILTPREWEVLELLRQGLSNPEIAQRLGISPAGARYHVSEILGKLAVESRQEAARWRPAEGRRPWWTAAFVPVTALWRQAGALPAGLSTAATAISGGLLVAAFAGLGLMAFLLVRAGDEEGPRLVADSTAVPTATAGETPGRTGIAEIDVVLDALFSGEADAVRALIRYTTIPCVVEVPGLGGLPLCLPDEPDGTPVEVFPVAECEGSYARPDNIENTVRWLTAPDKELYAVYRSRGLSWPPGEYIVIFSTESMERVFASGLSLEDGRIVGLDFGCAQSPESLIEVRGLADAVLPPPPTPRPTPRLTGIAEIDAIVDAVESGERDRVLAFLRFTQFPCEPSTSDSARIFCRPDEREGTLVDVIPLSVCGELLVRRDNFGPYLAVDLVDPLLYGVYRAPPGFEPPAEYVAVFSKPRPERRQGLAVAVDQGQIVKVFFALISPGACALTAAALVDGLGLEDAILPPPATPSP